MASLTNTTTTTTHFSCIIIGSGQAGTPLSAAYAKAGHTTALIERSHVGGCCVNEGCTPTKTMIASGRAAYMVRRAAEYGIRTNPAAAVAVDMPTVRQRKRDMVASFRAGNESRTRAAGVELVMGEARFTGPKALAVRRADGSELALTADTVFINAGERPAPPALPGVETVEPARVLDSTSVQELAAVPDHLIVLGGGYVGVEFAQLFRRLGAEVTLVQRAGQLLPREDPEVADALLQILREDGLTVHLSTGAVKIAPAAEGGLALTGESGGSTVTVAGSHLLVATGRVPNTDTLDLPRAGIATDAKGYVRTSPLLETSAAGVYALGDVKGPPAFTHISYDDFRIAQHNLLTAPAPASPLTTTNRLVPYVVYTDPQLGHVGLHHAEAVAKFPARTIQTASMPMAWVARALETGEARGMMKAVVDADSGEILGFSCLGIEGGELMSMVQVAMMGGLPWQRLRDAVWAHPALAESLNNLWGSLK